jgi:hypothetical protein
MKQQAKAIEATDPEGDFELVKPEVDAPKCPGHRMVKWRNPTDRAVVVFQNPDMKIPPGKACEFPAGYHRAIHRRAPQLLCEAGKACEVAASVRGD